MIRVLNQEELDGINKIEQEAIQWAEQNKLRKVELGARYVVWPGFERVDIVPEKGIDIVTDLNNPWPIPNNSVGCLKAHHVFEHLNSAIHAMTESWRVLAPGGWLLLQVPSTGDWSAFQDPTHRNFWNLNSIWYYTWRADYLWPFGFEGVFDKVFEDEFYVTEWHKETHQLWDYFILRAKK